MENSFEIISYIGAKPLLFGMIEAQVEKLVGLPLSRTVNSLGEGNAQYNSYSVRFSPKDNRLVEIGFSSSANVSFSGLDIFRRAGAFHKLLLKDSSPYEYYGFIVLLDLGITLTGFNDNDASQYAVTAFARGRWDHLKPKFKTYIGNQQHGG